MKNFVLDKIETRSQLDGDGNRRYIVRGYATTPNKKYITQTETINGKTKSFKEYFTKKAEESIKRQLSSKKVFADIEHQMAGSINIKKALMDIKKRSGVDISDKESEILAYTKSFDVPLMKVSDFELRDNGFFVETEFNPHFKNIDIEHKNYFDSIWGMTKEGFLDRFSLNMNITDYKNENGVNRIDDVDVYGISLTGGGANDWLPPVEVAMRCVINYEKGDGKKWEKKKVRTSLML